MDAIGTFPRIRVAGEPRDRGRAYGVAAADRIARSLEAYRAVYAEYTGWDWSRIREIAGRFEAPIVAFAPRYLEELRGIGEGSGLDLPDVLALNVRTEIMYPAIARSALRGRRPPLECSAFALLPEASADGHTLIGQNWDWLIHSQETVVVLEVEQDRGPDYVTVVEAGLLAKTGMNSSGIGLATNALVTAADVGEPGIPYHVTLRAILDAETIADAHAVLQRGFRSSSANYLIAHRDGLGVDIEAAPGDFSGLIPLLPDRGLLLHTNHFQSPRLLIRDLSLWSAPGSIFRLQRLGAAAREAGPGLSLEDFRRILSDHAGYPQSICAHPDDRLAPLDRSATIASVLMDLDSRHMWVSDGRPCSNRYHPLEYRDFLAKPPSVEPVSEGRSQ